MSQASSFNDISLQILRLANKGLTRERFKHQVAEILIAFSSCDVLEVFIFQDDKPLFWRTEHTNDKSIHFEKRTCEDDVLSFYVHLMQGQSELPPTCISQHGSYWTGGKECIPSVLKNHPDYRDFASLLMIPFEIDGEKQGLLVFKSRKRNFFPRNELSLYEQLALTLGIAVSDRRAQFSLRERIKELTCLYSISKIIHETEQELPAILQKIVDIIPPAFQYPDAVLARISMDDMVFVSGKESGGSRTLRSAISVEGKELGSIKVLYKKEEYDFEDEPFLREEQHLLDTIAKQVGIFVEDKKVEEEKKKLQEQLLHADRLATIGELGAGVAHELNEPLVNILGYAQLIKEEKGLKGQAAEDIDKIISASLHAREIVKKLLTFSRQIPSIKKQIDLNSVIRDGIYFLESRCKKEGITLSLDLESNLPSITADPAQMNQVMVNLVINSIQALSEGGEIIIRTASGGQYVTLTIEDNGTGMSPEVKKQIFIPFYTTKEVGKGTGLGLPVVHGIVTSHGGKIQVASSEGRGTRFDIVFQKDKMGD